MDPADTPTLPLGPSHQPAHKRPAVIQPLIANQQGGSNLSPGDAAANLIRQKIDALYGAEPDAKTEMRDSVAAGTHRSKHQKYMYELSMSGKPLAEIQAAWHQYYESLPDAEKHEVWQEFYNTHGQIKASPRVIPADFTPQQPDPATLEPIRSKTHHHPILGHTDKPAQTPSHTSHAPPHTVKARKKRSGVAAKIQKHLTDRPANRTAAQPAAEAPTQTVEELQSRIRSRINSRGKLKASHHLRSLVFGMSMGGIVVLILLFGFFNERFIAPIITPSRNVSATPIIIDPTKQTAAGTEPKIIIPKINVEVPVVYDMTTNDERAIQDSLEHGVVRYASTSLPGETGNTVIVGHSSNNILNQGKYKFAFVLLSRLEPGDLFILQRNGKQYVYKVFNKEIVKPTEVSVLTESPKPSMATLITCDPPGTTINRLVVQGEQITPDPVTNVARKPSETNAAAATVVPGNAPSLFQRLMDAIF